MKKQNETPTIDVDSEKSLNEQLVAQAPSKRDWIDRANKPTVKNKKLREETFLVIPADIQAAFYFTSSDENARQLRGISISEAGIAASDGKHLILINHSNPEKNKGYFAPVTLSNEFVKVLLFAANISGVTSIPIEIKVFEKQTEGELPISTIYSSALGIEMPVYEGDYPNLANTIPYRNSTEQSSAVIDARYYMHAVKARYLVLHHTEIKKAESHVLPLTQWKKGDDVSIVGYRNAKERLQIYISPCAPARKENAE